MFSSLSCPDALTHAEALRRASALLPLLGEQARLTEQLRRLPDTHVDALREQRLFGLLAPHRHGGSALPPATLVAVTATLARACASTAWVYAHLARNAWALGMFPALAQEAVWAGAPQALIGASLTFASGRALPLEQGYILEGSWRFATGIDHCQWVILGAVVAGSDELGLESAVEGSGEYRLFLLPREDCEVRDIWHAAGLRGAGSQQLNVSGARVPAPFSLALRDTYGGVAPGGGADALYQVPLLPALGSIAAGVPLGVAEGALAFFIGEQRQRIASSYSGRALADFASVQARVAEAAVEVESARLMLAANCADMLAAAQSGRPALERKALWRRDAAHAARCAVRAVDLLFEAGGASALFDTHPLQRAFRDAHAAASTISLNWDAQASIYGRVLLGLHGELAPYER